MSLRKLAALVSVGLGLAGGMVSVQAAPIGLDQWYEFGFLGVPSEATACVGSCTPLIGGIDAPVDAPWTISGPVLIRVTDAFISVDQFEIFDNAVSVGVTSVPTPGGSCGPSVFDCFTDADFSSGTFELGGGDHSITITHIAGVPGAAFFRVEQSQVPVPGTLALLALGLAGLGLRRKRA